jgi:hypothetical protein
MKIQIFKDNRVHFPYEVVRNTRVVRSQPIDGQTKIERDDVYRLYYVEILYINPPQNKYTRYTGANSATLAPLPSPANQAEKTIAKRRGVSA